MRGQLKNAAGRKSELKPTPSLVQNKAIRKIPRVQPEAAPGPSTVSEEGKSQALSYKAVLITYKVAVAPKAYPEVTFSVEQVGSLLVRQNPKFDFPTAKSSLHKRDQRSTLSMTGKQHWSGSCQSWESPSFPWRVPAIIANERCAMDTAGEPPTWQGIFDRLLLLCRVNKALIQEPYMHKGRVKQYTR